MMANKVNVLFMDNLFRKNEVLKVRLNNVKYCDMQSDAYYSYPNPHSIPFLVAGTPFLIHTGAGAPLRKWL